MLRHALEAHGHVVLEARDEPEALHYLQQSRPAVVLTDLKLPNGDGFGVLRAAKELDPELQVVVMTGPASSVRIRSCARCRSSCTAPRRPMPPCCSKAKAAPARSCSPARCTR
jgi:CheY-like chemotaxis protein